MKRPVNHYIELETAFAPITGRASVHEVFDYCLEHYGTVDDPTAQFAVLGLKQEAQPGGTAIAAAAAAMAGFFSCLPNIRTRDPAEKLDAATIESPDGAQFAIDAACLLADSYEDSRLWKYGINHSDLLYFIVVLVIYVRPGVLDPRMLDVLIGSEVAKLPDGTLSLRLAQWVDGAFEGDVPPYTVAHALACFHAIAIDHHPLGIASTPYRGLRLASDRYFSAVLDSTKWDSVTSAVFLDAYEHGVDDVAMLATRVWQAELLGNLDVDGRFPTLPPKQRDKRKITPNQPDSAKISVDPEHDELRTSLERARQEASEARTHSVQASERAGRYRSRLDRLERDLTMAREENARLQVLAASQPVAQTEDTTRELQSDSLPAEVIPPTALAGWHVVVVSGQERGNARAAFGDAMRAYGCENVDVIEGIPGCSLPRVDENTIVVIDTTFLSHNVRDSVRSSLQSLAGHYIERRGGPKMLAMSAATLVATR